MTIQDRLETVGVTLAITAAMFATLCTFAAAVARSTGRVVVVLALLLGAGTAAHAEDHDRSRLAIASLAAGTASIGLSAADAWITYRAVSDGLAREANPWLVPYVESHGIGRTMAAKFAIDVGGEAGLRYIEHRWPKQQKAVLAAKLAMVGVRGFVVAHNLRVLRSTR